MNTFKIKNKILKDCQKKRLILKILKLIKSTLKLIYSLYDKYFFKIIQKTKINKKIKI